LLLSNGDNVGSLLWQHEVEVAAAQNGVAVEIPDALGIRLPQHILLQATEVLR
jgi:hypothetical protein